MDKTLVGAAQAVWVGSLLMVAPACSSGHGISVDLGGPPSAAPQVPTGGNGPGTPGGSGGGGSSGGGGTSSGGTPNPGPSLAPAPSGPVVCNPWGGGTGLSPSSGLIAQLWYAQGDACSYDSVWDYENFGQPVSTPFYFDQLNVPTRFFRDGFPTEDGRPVTDQLGRPVLTNFALRFRTVISLGADQEPGLYQLAVISDDGAVVRIGSDLQKPGDADVAEIIDNDGDHPSRLACADHALRFDHGTSRDVRVDYYQGPRYEMALLLLWRKVSDDLPSTLADPACGLEGNEQFFNPYPWPSGAQATWIDMLERGWRVLGPDQYTLPPGTPSNPCGSPAPTPTGSPTSTPTPAPTGSPTSTPTPTPTGSPTSTPTPTPTGSPTSTPTPAPTGSPTSTPTPTPTGSPSSTPEPTPTPSFTPPLPS